MSSQFRPIFTKFSALDTASPLPLFNSLTHLVYLTSTSPRIREIMTQDGGLERMVRMLHDYCMSPPPPENPAMIYGLTPPNTRPPKPTPTLNPTSFDKHAAYRFSLAFQCVVNVGVRGSEQIRTRVVQAGTLDVVGCVLEAWLANKGFAVGPTGAPKESKEQRHARRLAQQERQQREDAAQLQRALQRQLQRRQEVCLHSPFLIIAHGHRRTILWISLQVLHPVLRLSKKHVHMHRLRARTATPTCRPTIPSQPHPSVLAPRQAR